MTAKHPRHPENWYDKNDLAALRRAVHRFKAQPSPPVGAAVEVGSFTGQSMELLVAELGPMIAVDPWGDMTYADRPDLTAEYAYPRFLKNLKGKPVSRFRCGWEQFFEMFDGPLAFIHIDAVHEYDHVFDNIEEACYLLEPGGMICGHDHWDMFPGVEQAVSEHFPDGYTVDERVWSWLCE